MWPFKSKRKDSARRRPALPDPVNRNDGFINLTTGFGVKGVDKTLGDGYVADLPYSNEFLDDLYFGNDLVGLCIDIPVDEALRQNFEIKTGDKDEDDALSQWKKDTELLQKVGDAARWGRLYGQAAILLGTKDGAEPHEPLELDSVKSLDWLMILDKSEMFPVNYGPDGEPTTYQISPRTHGATATRVVHASRLVLFGGKKTTKRKKLANAGSDASVIQTISRVVEQFEAAFTNAGVLLADGNQAVFKMSGLANSLASEDENAPKAIEKRFALMQWARSVHRALVLDAGDGTGEPPEDFERKTAQFAGLEGLMDKFILRLSSALRIPSTILMGQSPAGLSATGESDIRWFYDRTASYQELDLTPKIERILNVLRSSADWDKSGEELSLIWPQLWTASELDRSTARLNQANTDVAYINAGVLQPEEVTLARFGGDGYSYETALSDDSLEQRQADLEADIASASLSSEVESDATATE